MKIFLAFAAFGLIVTLRSRLTLRDYNRRMYPSMQEGRPTYLWNMVVFMLIGAGAAAACYFIKLK